jgi:DNA repair exonuclease SbcCD ATPase subunit
MWFALYCVVQSAAANGGGGGEDMQQVLMEQLAQMSQNLADSRMAAKEFQEAAARAQAAQAAAEAELAAQIKKVEAQAAEMSRLRDKVSFAALDATNEQLKQARAEAAEAKTENEALKDQNRILYQNYADIKSVECEKAPEPANCFYFGAFFSRFCLVSVVVCCCSFHPFVQHRAPNHARRRGVQNCRRGSSELREGCAVCLGARVGGRAGRTGAERD